MRTKLVLLTGALTAGLAILAACSSDDKAATIPPLDGGADATGDVLGEASAGPLVGDGLAKAFCEKIAECTVFVDVAYGDLATCSSRLGAQLEKDIRLPGNTATQAEVDQCAQAVKASTCKDVLSNKLPAVCKKAGTLADGATCGAGGQCASQACHRTTDGGNCGSCGARFAAGATCVENDDCQDGLVCNKQKKCTAPPKDGEDCSQTDCEYGLACVSGKCAAALGENAACTRTTDSDPCDLLGKGLVCLGGSCTKVGVAKAGQPCGLVGGTKFAVCGSNAHCDLADGSAEGVCAAILKEGDACDDAAGKKCLDPAKCVSGKCTMRDPTVCK